MSASSLMPRSRGLFLPRNRVERGPAAGSSLPVDAGAGPAVGPGCRWLAGFVLAWLFTLAGTASELTWLWANPHPHGNNLYDIAYVKGLNVAVGDRGQLYTSLDRELWIPQETRTTRALRAITPFQDRLVVVGEAGTVVCADLTSLTNLNGSAAVSRVDLGTTDWLEGVTASSKLVVAVGDNGAIYSSPDGTNWTRRPQGFSTWFRSVAYGQNLFVGVGESGLVATSSDGLNWTRRTSGTTANLNRVAWVGGQCLAVGDGGTIIRSSNGTTWRAFSPAAGITSDLYFVAGETNSLGGISHALVGGDSVLRVYQPLTAWTDETNPTKSFAAPSWSYYCGVWDGIYYAAGGPAGVMAQGFKTNLVGNFDWINDADSVRAWLWDIGQLGSQYFAVGDLGTILSSSDGVNWELNLVPGSAADSVIMGIGGVPGRFVAVGSRGTILTSANGVVWGAVTPSPVQNDLQGVAVWGGEIFVSGGAGTILSTADGASWRVRPAPTTSFLSSLAATPQGLVCAGADGMLFTSTDGSGWTRRMTGTTNWLSRVRSVGGLLLAVGENGTILTSLDGAVWTQRSSGTTSWLNDVAWFEGAFYAVGTQGTVLSSPDGVSWTSIGTVTQKSLYGVRAGTHQLLAVGIDGVILRGQPGSLVFTDYQRVQGTNSFRLSGKPGRLLNLEQATQLNQWAPLQQARFLDNSASLILIEGRTNAPSREAYRGRIP